MSSLGSGLFRLSLSFNPLRSFYLHVEYEKFLAMLVYIWANKKTTRTSRTSRTWKSFNTAWSHPIAATVRCGIGVGRQLQSVSYVIDKTSKSSATCEINWADCQFTCEMCGMCGMFSFYTIYIYLQQKNPDEIGDFCEGRADDFYFTTTLNCNLSGVNGQGNTVFHARKQRFIAKKTLFSQWWTDIGNKRDRASRFGQRGLSWLRVFYSFDTN